ncbi:hypothetical protein FPV67DRAFT_276706 [Lyophyllum atratum]|nr:hypothetical protein FPV67DRAFT_276706 [Lyophyllum atratum]
MTLDSVITASTTSQAPRAHPFSSFFDSTDPKCFRPTHRALRHPLLSTLAMTRPRSISFHPPQQHLRVLPSIWSTLIILQLYTTTSQKRLLVTPVNRVMPPSPQASTSRDVSDLDHQRTIASDTTIQSHAPMETRSRDPVGAQSKAAAPPPSVATKYLCSIPPTPLSSSSILAIIQPSEAPQVPSPLLSLPPVDQLYGVIVKGLCSLQRPFNTRSWFRIRTALPPTFGSLRLHRRTVAMYVKAPWQDFGILCDDYKFTSSVAFP